MALHVGRSPSTYECDSRASGLGSDVVSANASCGNRVIGTSDNDRHQLHRDNDNYAAVLVGDSLTGYCRTDNNGADIGTNRPDTVGIGDVDACADA